MDLELKSSLPAAALAVLSVSPAFELRKGLPIFFLANFNLFFR